MIIAYIDAGTVAVIGAAAAGGLTGVKALVSAKITGRRKKEDTASQSPEKALASSKSS